MTRYPDQEIVPSPRLLWHCEAFVRSDLERTYGPFRDHLLPADDQYPAHLVSSECEDGLHRLLLDIDTKAPPPNEKLARRINEALRWLRQMEQLYGPVEMLGDVRPDDVIYQPSTSNWHAYVPTVALPWEQMYQLLSYLIDLVPGLTNDWVNACDTDAMCALRLPTVRKPPRSPTPLVAASSLTRGEGWLF